MIAISALQKLVDAFNRLPGIGPKMAERLAYHILQSDPGQVAEFVRTIEDVKKNVMLCRNCFSPSEKELCRICSDDARDHTTICVVEKIEDLMAIENTAYNGVYHILGGVLSPLDGYGPSSLRIKELLERLNGSSSVQELIIATNPTTEGEVTSNYISDLLKSKKIKVTRLGYGLPMGGSLEYADEITLKRSFESRKEITV
jgi:recombination protein RecR